jgi:ABC-type proline/glycine betaine transport system substrate-binding protein
LLAVVTTDRDRGEPIVFFSWSPMHAKRKKKTAGNVDLAQAWSSLN